MPEINVTMDDGPIAVDVTAPFGYRDAGAVASALDDQTITPAQVGTASDPVDESHTTVQHSQELSNIKLPDTAEFETVLSNATHGDVVMCRPNRTYTLSGEATVPEGVTLDTNGATLTNSGDHNILFVDNSADVTVEIDISDPDNYTSDVIVLDTDRSTHGRYNHDGNGQAVSVEAYVEGTDVANPNAGDSVGNTGTALALRGTDSAITLGCKFWLSAHRMHTGIHADVTSSTGSKFIQSPQFNVQLNNGVNYIDQSANCNFDSYIYGTIQIGDKTEDVIRNQGTGNAPTFIGKIWDPHRANSDVLLTGPNINVGLDNDHMSNFMDSSSPQLVYSFNQEGMELYSRGQGMSASVADDGTWTVNPDNYALNQYASASDAPTGSDVGIIGVTSDGHLLMEDGQ